MRRHPRPRLPTLRFYTLIILYCHTRPHHLAVNGKKRDVVTAFYSFLIALRHFCLSFSDSCGCIAVPPRSMVATILKPE